MYRYNYYTDPYLTATAISCQGKICANRVQNEIPYAGIKTPINYITRHAEMCFLRKTSVTD